MSFDLDRPFTRPPFPLSGWRRLPTIARDAIVATSHPLATRAGVRALEAGGNATDAALAAAAMLTVAEPGHNGIGGDLFALVWNDGELHALNGSGRSPSQIDEVRVDEYGPRSVTVPGAVDAWQQLATRFGRFDLDGALIPAAEAGERGIAATARVATHWQLSPRAPWPAPRAGDVYRLPELARTLRRIAAEGPDALYRGDVARQIAAASWLSEDDLAAHRSDWVEPVRGEFRGLTVCECPPNTQGVAVLVALAALPDDDDLAARIDAVRAGLEFAHANVGHQGDTTYLCVVDGDRNAVSLIQSTYEHFGSGVVAGDTGIVLQNRGACFVETEGHPNVLAPGKRPFHTIIPGMLLRDGKLLGPFGIMGGPMQAQAHVQFVIRVANGDDPQAALDSARFRVEAGRRVVVEPGLAHAVEALRERGDDAVVADAPHGFGVGQSICVLGESLIAGSDSRADGHAAGI
ncbi:MAG: gamma-glutamyltransferase family protein [Gaiellaceae bacterium]